MAGEALIARMPFPFIPFQTHVNIVFENGLGETTKKVVKSQTGCTRQEVNADTPVENLKMVNQKFA